mgnify:CR=1 FL=1
MPIRNRSAYAFLAPYLIVFATFWVWPIISSFLISFQNTRVNPWKFSLSANWGRLFGDPAFYNALYNTQIILVIQVPVMIAIATVMAVLLNSPLLKLRPLFRFAFFAPVVVGEVAYAAVFRLMFSIDFGIVNKLITSVGLPAVSWFDNANAAMALVIIAVTWRWAGYNAIIILAGLQSIPDDVYEAATLDRVSKTQQFFHITLPLLKPIILFCVVLSAALHRAVPDHQSRRSGRRHGNARSAALPPGLPVSELRLCVSRRLHNGSARRCNLAAQSVGREGAEMKSKSQSLLLRKIALHAVLTPLAIIWLFPLWMMFIFSTMPDYGIFSPEIVLLPSTNFVANFQDLEAQTGFTRAMFTSISVAVIYTVLSVLLTSMAGWALARYRFAGRSVVVAIILGTITLPFAVVVIPQFIMVAREFKLANTWVALIVPPLFNSLGVLFMRQSFSMMPNELFDAARVEGVKEWQIFLRIALPLARPTMAALAIILFLVSWNNYLWPLLINSRPAMMTAPVALGTLIGLTKVSWGGIMAGATMLTAPILIVFVLLQRHFIAGIAAGAIK